MDHFCPREVRANNTRNVLFVKMHVNVVFIKFYSAMSLTRVRDRPAL